MIRVGTTEDSHVEVVRGNTHLEALAGFEVRKHACHQNSLLPVTVRGSWCETVWNCVVTVLKEPDTHASVSLYVHHNCFEQFPAQPLPMNSWYR